MSSDVAKIRIAIAQINLHVGAIHANTQLVLDTINEISRDQSAELIIFPELTLTSYPPEDLLLRTALYQQIEQSLVRIIESTRNVDVIIGYPLRENGKLYNACSLIRQQSIAITYYKQCLPNYGVFDEKRYFEPGDKTCLFDIKGTSVALSICEDIWDSDPSEKAKNQGADLIVNINASPFHQTKQKQRQEMLEKRARESGLDIVYVNLVGGQDELVFDGRSMAINHNGKIDFEADAFNSSTYIIEYQKEQRCFTHSYPDQAEDNKLTLIYQALVLGVRDYVHKNGFKGAIIGLSGGIDSALCLCIAVDALAKENVEVLLMPSEYTSDMSNEDAEIQASRLGVQHHIVPIEKPFKAFLETLEPLFSGLPTDTTEENIQARCRGVLLMALSNKTRKLVLSTGNKSEMSVGYATLYGDMAGGFAPLKDVPKMLVYELARWRNREKEIIPRRVIERPPSAELKHDQKDEDSLPSYEILDPILQRYIEKDESPEKIIAAGFSENNVRDVVRLVDLNEYKRRQAAPGVRISQRAFGRDRRYPITSAYRED